MTFGIVDTTTTTTSVTATASVGTNKLVMASKGKTGTPEPTAGKSASAEELRTEEARRGKVPSCEVQMPRYRPLLLCVPKC